MSSRTSFIAATAGILATAGLVGYLWHQKKTTTNASNTAFQPSNVANAKRVLVLGGGNLSWSLATVRSLNKKYWVSTEHLLVTTYDTLDELHERYPNDPIDEIILEMTKEVRGTKVIVAHHFDATQLRASLVKMSETTSIPSQFDVIVFNFPHWGGRGYIQRNRALLRKFFTSVQASNALAPQGEIHLALKEGQGGTPVDLDLGNKGNTWRPVEYAAAADFVLGAVEPFVPPEGYYCSGRRGTQKSFWLGGALNHVFVHADDSKRPPKVPPAGVHPTLFTFDVSFWILEEMKYEDVAVLTTVMNGHDCVRSVVFEDEIWAVPRDPLIGTTKIRSMVFRITYQSRTKPMSRERMLVVHDGVREILGRALCPTILVRGSTAFQQEFIAKIHEGLLV